MANKSNVYGEGNYAASRRYFAGVKKFVDSGGVEANAGKAAPTSPSEAAEMQHAEQAALLKAKGTKQRLSVKEPQRPAPPITDPRPEPDVSHEGSDVPAPRPGTGPDRR
ncbi:MAG: hypothetical protein ABI724_04025 [Betaproteobacteria bacterium]